jgi:hypothetical protein
VFYMLLRLLRTISRSLTNTFNRNISLFSLVYYKNYQWPYLSSVANAVTKPRHV